MILDVSAVRVSPTSGVPVIVGVPDAFLSGQSSRIPVLATLTVSSDGLPTVYPGKTSLTLTVNVLVEEFSQSTGGK